MRNSSVRVEGATVYANAVLKKLISVVTDLIAVTVMVTVTGPLIFLVMKTGASVPSVIVTGILTGMVEV